MNTSSFASTRGLFNYLDPSVPHSLYRNGRVLTRRDRDGSDSGMIGLDLAKQELEVADARGLSPEQRRSVEKNGFELASQSAACGDLDFMRHDQVVKAYYPDCARLVREATGAAQVFPFDHNVRSAKGKKSRERIDGGQQVQGPAHVVHGDYTLTSAVQRLRDLGEPPKANDTMRPFLAEGQALIPPTEIERVLQQGQRFAVINVWRNIAAEPVATHPLALCDAATVQPEDLVVFELHYEDRIGENYFAKHAERHRWFYYSGLTRDEALLIKQWDSEGAMARTLGKEGDATSPEGPCTFSFHSAFQDPNTPDDAPDRWSIEVRCAVLYGA